MDLKSVLISQFHAGLKMLRLCIEQCPDALWNDPADQNRFWHVAYHALFYVHLYISHTEDDFKPWSGHRMEYNFMGALPWPPHSPPIIGEPYTQAEVLQYLEVVWAVVAEKLAEADLDSPVSGFDWLPFGKLELQLYSLRHLQQHTGELMERLGRVAHIEVDWVGRG